MTGIGLFMPDIEPKIFHLSLNLFKIYHYNCYLQSMSNITDNNGNNPIEIFAGTAWEVALVQSLLENAEIKSYVFYGVEGTLAPLDSGSGLPINRIMVSIDDYDKAKQVVDQYYASIKE